MDKRTYFPGLNGLRAIAAFLVMVGHVEVAKSLMGMPRLISPDHVHQLAHKSVTLFFVLSGFLITYLLLKEIRATSNLDIKKFYSRRILRIWPLYYAMIALGFIILPKLLPTEPFNGFFKTNYDFKFFTFVFLLPNISSALDRQMSFVGPLWSIGVEWQFYLVWPFLLNTIKRPLIVFGTVIVACLLVRTLFFYQVGFIRYYSVSGSLRWLSILLFGLQFECMALGGLAAWLLVESKKKALDIIYSREIQITSFVLLVLLLHKNYNLVMFDATIYGVVFSIILLNVCSNPNSLLKLNYEWLDYLGKISYGIYIYHVTTIIFSLALLRALNMGAVAFQMSLYSGVIISTLCVSVLSYHCFEKRFLSLKEKYEIVTSSL